MTAFIGKTANAFGSLKPEVVKRLEVVIANPCQETWEEAYSIVLNASGQTLWQAWVEVDTKAVRGKPLDEPWPRIPDQLTIYRAIAHATGQLK